MGSLRSRLKSAMCGLFLVGPAAKVACHEENEQQSCSRRSPPPTNLPLGAPPMRYPEPREESTSIIRELLHPFSLQEFADKYWENKPLVIRGRSHKHYEHLVEFGLMDVESVIENGIALAGAGKEPMVLGSDWNIIKRVFVPADGEFWTAGLPPLASSPSSSSGGSPSGTRSGEEKNARGTRGQGGGEKRVVPLAEAHQAFHRGGFSLVINRLQRRWRGVWGVSHALEDVLGQPVNANLYMTPPEGQGFEAHFDWMDGIVVQLVGTKTWILYDEIIPSPRADLKYKPAASALGEPIAVLELRPGDLMYIPRGWPHEAAVNGTAAGGGGGSPVRGPSLHVTFGVETAVSGTYESLLHHALEVAAVHHPGLFGLPPNKEGGETESENGTGGNARAQEQAELPWLQLMHLWVHDVASRDSRLRRAVPLAPIFSPPAPPSTAAAGDGGDDQPHGDKNAREEGVCTEQRAHSLQQEAAAAAASSKVLPDFQLALDACAGTEGAASRTLALLASLLRGEGTLKRVREMFAIHERGPLDDGSGTGTNGGGPAPETEAAAELGREEAALSRPMHVLEKEWARPAFEAFDRASLSNSLLGKKIEGFQRVASPEMALQRMVLAATRRARARAAMTEQDLARCGQG